MSAIVLNGDNVIKITKRKFINNSTILEECSKDKLEEKYLYWYNLLNRKEDNEVLHHYKNSKTNVIIASIYEKIEDLKTVTKDWMYYEKLD